MRPWTLSGKRAIIFWILLGSAMVSVSRIFTNSKADLNPKVSV
jgi:flagellar motor protein MotB